MNTQSAVLQASATVEATPDQVRHWFLSLREHPERYQSETHGGFTFTKGSFGEAGARFETHERLAVIHAHLCFELTSVEARRFAFRLLRPPLGVWAAFQIEPVDEGQTQLSLLIGGENGLAERVLHLPPVRRAVRQQIQREVSHVQSSVERLQTGPWA